MVHVTEATTTITTGNWRELLGPRYLGTSAVLAGGVALYATNEFLTISLLPNTVADIGGERLYAWVTTLYLVGSVVAAAAVNSVLVRVGARSAYLLGLLVFGAGCVVCALAPRMEILLAGRILQGLGGGLLAGLGYALINAVLPQSLWTRASALVSAMWGVGTLIGPAAGGIFAQLGEWRLTFAAMAVLTASMAVSVTVVLAPGNGEHRGEPMKMPARSLLLLGTAALVVSVAQLPHNFMLAAGLLAA
ncbi:MAG: MFS transporter, partial [Mycobacterium sp.]